MFSDELASEIEDRAGWAIIVTDEKRDYQKNR